MSIKFTIKESKQLIDRHEALLSDLNYISSIATAIKNSIPQSANDLITKQILKKLILNDCIHPTTLPSKNFYPIERISTNSEVKQLIYNLYKYQKIQPTIETAKSFQFYTKNIQQKINVLKACLTGLSWFLAGKSKKEKVLKAYQELNFILNDDYGRLIPKLVFDAEAVSQISVDIAWNAFVLNPRLFADTLTLICPQILFAQKHNPFQTQLDQLEDSEKNSSISLMIPVQEKEQIKVFADKLIAFNALEILRSIPIEEINRDKARFRAKILRDEGFTTIADIFTSSDYQLSSLRGISIYAAMDMKKIAENIFSEVQQSVKITLNADDRNPQATELIKSIYFHRLKSSYREELKTHIQNKKIISKRAKKILLSIGNGLPWIFYSAEQRSEVRAAYEELISVLADDHLKEIIRLTNILLSNNFTPDSEVAWDDFKENNIQYISILEDIVPGALGNDDKIYGLPEDLAREIQEEVFFPDGLCCTLRRYQEWGVKYILHQKNVLLGDEMGLGKTIQSIATMVSLRNTGATHFVVICPASIITNWCREVVKHSKLRITKIYGAERLHALESWNKTGGVAITTFETTAYFQDDDIAKIDLLIVDEAHYIKNPNAHRSINVKRLCCKAERLLFMTGTALENKVSEMISLINILRPDIATSIQGMTFMPNAPQFRNRIAPVYYRRKREDVLTELPKLIETKEWCTLNSEEMEIYEQNILNKNYTASRRLSWNATNLKKSCKAMRLLEIIEQAKIEGRKVLVFSYFLDTIRVIGDLLKNRCYGPINGSVPSSHRQDIIDDFDRAPAGSVLLSQIQSGGIGLNIQSASVVVICEPQLKPSIENQAISRVYRMGQSRNVLVYRLLCQNTIDERITALLEYKQELFDAFADKSVAAEQNESHDIEVDDKKLGHLIQEEIDRINENKQNIQYRLIF